GSVGGGVPPVGVAVSLLVFRPVVAQFALLPVEGPGVPTTDEEPSGVVPPNGLTGQPPTLPIGCPKKPMTVGALFWPKKTGFQSSLPVVGSAYFLRRKR